MTTEENELINVSKSHLFKGFLPLWFVALISLFGFSAKSQTSLIGNGNFESGTTPWVLSGGAIISSQASLYHSPTHYLWLGDDNGTDSAYQTVTIPANATTATLSFYYNINTSETSGSPDTFTATIRSSSGTILATVGNWSNLNGTSPPGSPYYLQTYNLLPTFAGMTIRIYFTSVCTLTGSKTTNFRVDDVAMQATLPLTVQTSPASSITSTSAILNGTLNANGQNAISYFEWGTNTSYGNVTPPTTYGSGMTTTVDQSNSITGLLPNTLYYYRIDSYNTVITNQGNDSSFKTLGNLPAAPSDLTVANGVNGISLTWQDNSSNENGFYIQRSQGSSYANFSVAANQTSFTDTSAIQNNSYCYSVSATNSSGNSAFTSEQCTIYTIPGPAPHAIIAGLITPVTGTSQYIGSYSTPVGSLIFSWTTSDGQASTAPNPQFQFNNPGSYWIQLTVTDPSYRSNTALISITVGAVNNGNTIGVSVGADPVVLATGNYVQNHVDLQMPGIGFPFQFSRFYNSQFSTQSGTPLGYGWTFGYNEQIQNTGTNVLFIQGDGSTWTFYPNNGGYVGEPGMFDTLVYNNSNNTWTLTDKGQTVTSFDSNGRLAFITDKNGNTLTCSNVAGVFNTIQDTAGRTVSFTTNSYGCIASMTDPLNRTVRYFYDSRTNLTEVVDANLNTNFYFYDANHQMTNAVDGRGVSYIQNVYDPINFTVIRQCDAYTNWTCLHYDFTNRITYVTNVLGKVSTHFFDSRLLETNVVDEAGNQEGFSYDANRDRTLVQDKNGNQTQYGYDSLGNVTNKIDALNNVTTIQYDAFNNPIQRVDALTNVTTFGYDSHGNLTSTTNALGLTSSAEYNASGLPIILTDARGFSTTNQYDLQGNRTNAIDAHGFASQFVFDGAGRKIQQIDSLARSTSFAYDNDDNLTNSVNALNYTNSFAYDADNNRISSTDPRGATIADVFDLKDQLIAVLAPLNQTNETIYDTLDRKIATFDALGNQTEYAYDPVGNVIAVTNALNQVTQFTYDPQGNQTSVIDPTGHYITNSFDALNRQTATINVSISTNSTAYDALSRASATTNANGQVTQFFYDGIGRLTNVVDMANQSVFFAYDQNGNRVLTTDPNGHSWTNVFDELNRLIEQDDPGTNKTAFCYDPVGNLTNKVTANGDSVNYSYDALNELTNIEYPAGTPVTFAYDSVGNRTNLTDSLGTTAWQFDLLNRLTSVTDPYGQTIANGFDANGNRISLTYPGSKVVNYGFDHLNRMTALTNWLNGVVTYGYDSRGNLAAATNANGTTVAYAYDVADRLVALTNAVPNGNVIAAFTLTLDSIGNPTQASHNQPLFPILSSQTNNCAYDSDNRLISSGGQAVTYNANGDLMAIGTNFYAYDFENRLVRCSLTNTFAYDGLGNRLARVVSGQPVQFVLDRMGALPQVLIDDDTNNSPIAYYVYGLGLAEQVSSGGTVDSYHFDIQGSTVALTDSAGNVTDSYAFDSFGVLANAEEACPQPFRYLGRYGILDDGTGLLYARARYFSPQLGRFFTIDTATSKDDDGQTLNRFVYSLNNPLRFIDITGLSAQEWQVDDSTISYLAPSDTSHSTLLLNQAAIGFLSGLDDGLSPAEQLAINQTTGQLGEQAANIIKNTARIDSFTETASYRIPDVLDHEAGIIGEIKNVERLAYTSQLRDFVAYAKQRASSGFRFVLQTRPATKLSGPLKQAVDDGDIILQDIGDDMAEIPF
jgi:RHS repeat-associated protein